MRHPPSSLDRRLGSDSVHKAWGTPASQPLVPEGAKFGFAFTLERAAASRWCLGLLSVCAGLHVELKH